MNILNEHVSTQYNDFEGNVSIDFHGGGLSLHSFSRDKGLDTDKYFPIALRLFDFTTDGVGLRGEVPATIYYVKKEKYGNTFDDISLNIREQNGVVDVESYSVKLPYNEIPKYFKRVDILAISKMSNSITKLNINED